MSTLHTNISQVAESIAKNEQNVMLEQLNEFIKRGLIVAESQGTPQFFRRESSDELEICSSIRLRLKDQEYIEELEHKLGEAESKLSHIRAALSEIEL